MKAAEALEITGVKRVIWIDDKFNDSAQEIADLLWKEREVAEKCAFPELKGVFENAKIDEAKAKHDLDQRLADLPAQSLAAIKKRFFEEDTITAKFPTKELSSERVDEVCTLLNIVKADRWTFDKAFEEIGKMESGSDAGTLYVVDLNDEGVSETRGLEILTLLDQRKSRGCAFILTHETTTADEAAKEESLRGKLLGEGVKTPIPICAVAKERILDAPLDVVEPELVIACKRAALRKSIFDVIGSARQAVTDSFEVAAGVLLATPPETLQKFVFEPGYLEGVSELHVVQRILTTQLGKAIRSHFGSDAAVLASAFRIRELRDIPLGTSSRNAIDALNQFREAEVWEDADLLNKSFTPISCGDVFELDQEEKDTNGNTKRFVLLGQPCDIALRSKEDRILDTAHFVLLKEWERGEDGKSKPITSSKVLGLPFQIEKKKWLCDFRLLSSVCLGILDLASFRDDGRVRVDDGHKPPAALLASQAKIYSARTKAATAILAAGKKIVGGGQVVDGLQLCTPTKSIFKKFYVPHFVEKQKTPAADDPSDNKKRVTWRLRRIGRIREPYVGVLLEMHVNLLGRRAFDDDYLKFAEDDVAARNAEVAPAKAGGEGGAIEPADEVAVVEPAEESKSAPKGK